MTKTVFFLTLTFLTISAWGITVTVEPGDDIAGSLLSLSQGDTLFLMPGIYTDASEIPLLTAGTSQSGVTITSMPFNRAVLDGQNRERSVLLLEGPHECDIILENLVITGGNATGATFFKGGGISAIESRVLVSNCLISDNKALIGGGVDAEGGVLQLRNSILRDNEALVTGGGIDIYACDFTGFMLKFISNTSSDDGGGLNAYQSTIDLSNSLFTGNYTGDDGGAITVLQGISSFSFLTINANEAFDDGGGMRIHTVDSVSIVSSIITSNEGKAGINVIGTSALYFSNVCCWNNTFANYHGIEDPTGTGGNISVDPLYADLEFNLSQTTAGQHLDSPALDAGHAPALETSIAGLSTRTDSIPDVDYADMGYHHINAEQGGISPEQPDRECSMTIMPSPAYGSVTIRLTSKVPAQVVIHVYDITGRRIHTTGAIHVTGETSCIWHPDDYLPTGFVLFQAIWPRGITYGRIVLLK